MLKIMESLKVIESELENDEAVISVDYSATEESFVILLKHTYFIEMAEDEFGLTNEDVEVDIYKGEEQPFHSRLSFEVDGIKFLSLITKQEYEDTFEEWLQPSITDEEFITSPLTRYERNMKELGHKINEFI